jgi:NEDD8-activating enzyme E1 regulatory subunit|tara:strand:- start:47 stop:1060 length:1014 start_codon:yes stop_codon:yes gene_type:complete
MNDSTFTHTPFVVLLVQAFLRWRAVNAEDSLQDSGSQQSFKQAIRLLRCTHSEESIKEALGAVRHVWKPLSVPVNVRESLEKLAIKELTANTPKFWFQVAGLRAFLDASGGLLPLRGDIPDMTSSTEAFVAIQRLYREKAAFDASAVHANILDAFRQAGKCEEGYTLTNSTFFCRNAANLRVKEWCSLAEEISWSAGCSDAISNQLAREDTRSCAALYLLLRAVDSFQEKYGRAPGALPEKKILSGNSSVIALEQDVSRLRAILHGILYEIGLNNFGTFDDLISEFVRFGGGELHVVASVVAGICSQEIIKLVTHQFVPLGATLVYDAMSSTTVSIL